MKKEKKEFTILRYLGRPPTLFDDAAIAAVQEIISTAGDKFNWNKFTEYAIFHKLSQTLYPNMKKFEEERKEEVTAKDAKARKEEIYTCGASQEEELATKGHKGHKGEIYTCGAREEEEVTAKDAKVRQEDRYTCGASQEEELATKGHKGHKGEIYTCGANIEEEVTAKDAKTRKEEMYTCGAREENGLATKNTKTLKGKNKFKFVAEFMFWNKTKYSNISFFKNLCELCVLCGKKNNKILAQKEEIYTCGAREEDGLASSASAVPDYGGQAKKGLTIRLRRSGLRRTSENGVNDRKISNANIPDTVVRKFQGIFFANAARNEFLAKELVEINQLLEGNGIEVLNWKGPTLAIQAYGDLSLRQFKDLDTLVKHKDLEKAKVILLENGFEDITSNRMSDIQKKAA